MKIELTTPITGLDGKPANEEGKPVSTGKVLSTNLAQATEGDSLKFYGWAQKLYADQPIEVDDSDFKKLKEFVEGAKTLTHLAKAQILINMDECKERSKK